jgi:hypothetical protein
VLALAAVLACQVAPPALQGQHDPIRDWTYRRKETNPRTGIEEVTTEISGGEAIPIDLTRGKEVFEVREVRATYYTDPKPPRTTKVEKILIQARHARLDNRAGKLFLKELVRIERPGPTPDGAPSILTAPEAVVTFHPEFICSACGFKETKIGSCPLCGQPVRQRTAISVDAPRAFELVGPDGTVRGEGLEVDDDMADLRVERQGFLEVVGNPQALSQPGKAPALHRVISQLACRGPLHIRELAPGRRAITAREGVRLDRLDETGTETALADRMDITLGSRIDPATLRSVPVLERVEAAGDVRLNAVLFVEGRDVAARAESMRMDRRTFDDWETTRIVLEGAPAEVALGSTWVRSARISLEQPFGAALFEGGVEARISDLGTAGQPPVLLRSRTLAARLAPNANDVETLEAEGDVRLEGLLAAGGGGRAEADRFVWDRPAARGYLQASRVVRLEQGATRVLAPFIGLEDGGRSVLLQGPKQIVFVQEREGVRDELRASCEGDILYDAAAGRIRMRDRCLLRTADFRLSADRVDVELDPVKRQLASMSARGSIRAWRPAENVLLSGDRLAYDPVRQEFRLRGTPQAVASAGRAMTLQDEIILYETAAADGSRVRYTEMRGGGNGVRITIPEEPR